MYNISLLYVLLRHNTGICWCRFHNWAPSTETVKTSLIHQWSINIHYWWLIQGNTPYSELLVQSNRCHKEKRPGKLMSFVQGFSFNQRTTIQCFQISHGVQHLVHLNSRYSKSETNLGGQIHVKKKKKWLNNNTYCGEVYFWSSRSAVWHTVLLQSSFFLPLWIC